MITSKHYIYFEDAYKAREYLLSIKDKITRIITHSQMHHTYIPNYMVYSGLKGKPEKILQKCEDIRNWQMKNKDFWCGAQHGFTFPNGAVVLCKQGVADHVKIRDLNKKPAGIKGHNIGGICIENVGDFNWGKDAITEAQKETISVLYATLHEMFELPVNTETLVYHNWHSPTHKSCPGTGFMGGNSKQAAIKNLYPLVEEKLNEFKVPSWKLNGINGLAEKNMLKDPDQWRKNPDAKVSAWLLFEMINRAMDRLVGLISKMK